jgi:hypothetical protein
LLPGIICSAILTYTGVNITLQNGTVANIVKNLNDSSTWQETATNTQTIVLSNPIWISVHFMIFITLAVYFLVQVLELLTTKEKTNFG